MAEFLFSFYLFINLVVSSQNLEVKKSRRFQSSDGMNEELKMNNEKRG